MPGRYSRHYYDVYCIAKTGLIDYSKETIDLLTKVADFKAKFYPRGWARYDLARIGTLKIAPNNYYLPDINIKNLKIGEKAEASIFEKNEIRKLDITLKCKEDKPGWNKWLIVFVASGGYPKKIPKHTIIFQLTKINNNECQLSLLTKFHEPIDNEEFKELSNRKKYLLLSVKDYFENFYCPNTSNEN
jgi:hypothetical protein